jgi:hypothetical protein
MIKGYKASCNGKCMNDFLFEVGKIYEFDGKPILCQRGFHFCQRPDDVFNYYHFGKRFVLFEVIAHEEVESYQDKSCTNKIEIVRIIPLEEYNNIFKDSIFEFHKNGNLKRVCAANDEIHYDENGKTIYKKGRDGYSYRYDENEKLIWVKYPNGSEYEDVDNEWSKIDMV